MPLLSINCLIQEKELAFGTQANKLTPNTFPENEHLLFLTTSEFVRVHPVLRSKTIKLMIQTISKRSILFLSRVENRSFKAGPRIQTTQWAQIKDETHIWMPNHHPLPTFVYYFRLKLWILISYINQRAGLADYPFIVSFEKIEMVLVFLIMSIALHSAFTWPDVSTSLVSISRSLFSEIDMYRLHNQAWKFEWLVFEEQNSSMSAFWN